MATYYVATTGDDGASGDQAHPWATVAHAATSVSPGDTVIFENGTWTFDGQSSWTSGTSGNWVIFQARNSGQVTWQVTTANWLITLQNESYIEFDGIIFRGNHTHNVSRLVSIDNCDHITFTDCEATNTFAHCFYVHSNCTDLTLQDCEIHSEDTDYFRDGIYIIESSGNEDILIDGCEIYHVAHGGINVDSGDGVTITNCEIHDTMSHGLSIGGTFTAVNDVTIEYNTIYDVEQWGDPSGSPHNGIRVHDLYTDVLVAKNDIYNCDARAIDVRPHSGDTSIYIYHNSFYNCDLGDFDAGMLQIQNAYVPSGENPTVVVRNNIFYNTRAGAICRSNSNLGNNVSIDYNLYYTTSGDNIEFKGDWYYSLADYDTAGVEPHAVIDDNPDFVNPGTNFELQAGSPAIDAGMYVGYPYHGAAPDIGAHEYSAGGGGAVITVVVVVIVVVMTP